MVTNDLDGKPFQLKFVRAAQMMMFANVVCDPPLGQATVIPYDRATVRTPTCQGSPPQGTNGCQRHISLFSSSQVSHSRNKAGKSSYGTMGTTNSDGTNCLCEKSTKRPRDHL